MKNIIVIPARMGSSRFSGKPMTPILGIPMVEHVWLRCKYSKLVDEVYIATCDDVIFEHAKSIGAKVVMTGDHHERCTDRVEEAMLKIEKDKGIQVETVTIVQGDEPLVTTDMIDTALSALRDDNSLSCVNLLEKISDLEEFNSPNSIKVVTDTNGNAIYFSRSPIPFKKDKTADDNQYGVKQVCIMPFRRESLINFSTLEPTPLEISESIDMLRFVEHGHKVKMVFMDIVTQAVDVPSDVEKVEGVMKTDKLYLDYKK